MSTATLPGAPVRNGLPFRPYRYQGTGADVLTPFLDDEPGDQDARDLEAGLKPHGTPAAYRRHRRRGEPACRACLDGEAERQREAKGSPAYAARRREKYADARAAGLSHRQALEVRDRGLRCRDCGYLVTTVGHKTACGEAA